MLFADIEVFNQTTVSGEPVGDIRVKSSKNLNPMVIVTKGVGIPTKQKLCLGYAEFWFPDVKNQTLALLAVA